MSKESQVYYARNKDRIKSNSRQWYLENTERAKQLQSEWRERNPDRVKKYQEKAKAAYWLANPRKTVTTSRQPCSRRNSQEARRSRNEAKKRYHKKRMAKDLEYREKYKARRKEQDRRKRQRKKAERLTKDRICLGVCGKEKAPSEFRKEFSRICDECRSKKERDRERERRRTDIQFRILETLRRRLREVLKGERKAASTMALLDCTLAFFRRYIEGKFKRGMTWENYGTKWHLDHKFPCSKHDLTLPEEQRRCFHWTNFQPLLAEVNLRKGAKITEPQMALLFTGE